MIKVEASKKLKSKATTAEDTESEELEENEPPV
jgi:hypothetical protein